MDMYTEGVIMNISLRDLPAVMTVPEFAKVMRIGRNRAYCLVRERKVPVFYIGRSPRIPKDALLEYISSQVNTEGTQLRRVK